MPSSPKVARSSAKAPAKSSSSAGGNSLPKNPGINAGGNSLQSANPVAAPKTPKPAPPPVPERRIPPKPTHRPPAPPIPKTEGMTTKAPPVNFTGPSSSSTSMPSAGGNSERVQAQSLPSSGGPGGVFRLKSWGRLLIHFCQCVCNFLESGEKNSAAIGRLQRDDY